MRPASSRRKAVFFRPQLVWLLCLGPCKQHPLCIGHGESGLQDRALKCAVAGTPWVSQARRERGFCVGWTEGKLIPDDAAAKIRRQLAPQIEQSRSVSITYFSLLR